MCRMKPYLLCLVIIVEICSCFGSDGDRSPFYQNCLNNCITKNCTSDSKEFQKSAKDKQEFMNKLLLWNCNDECRYFCMWKTVRAFQERNWGVPKFHGKWPFIRVFGIQELGSVIGSVLNLVSHLFMYNGLRAAFSKKNTPLLWLWNVFVVVCANAWIWSIVFHTRDTPFTEFMDYACALSMVTILFASAIVRVAYGHKLTTFLALFTTFLYYLEHVIYLYNGNIDYEYNMMANILPGALAIIVWTVWGVHRYLKGSHYVWRLLLFNLFTAAFMALELFDFRPYMYLWDAHALWHVSTSILPLVFYRFVYDDLTYLRASWPLYTTKLA